MEFLASKSRLQRWQSARAFRFLSLLLCAWLSGPLLAGPVPTGKLDSYPAWWFQRDVIQRSGTPPPTAPAWPDNYPSADDFTAANIGQLKYFATQAAAELNVNLPGGAGTAINALIAGWSTTPGTDDFAALNLGQLKAVAALFYDQLIAAGYTSAYPWANGNPDDFTVANLGQLKYLFSFDLTYDSNGDGIPDWWAIAARFSPGDPSAAGSPVANPSLIVNGIPMTYLQAYLAGINAATAATADPNNPLSPQQNPVTDLPTVTYAAADVSSQFTSSSVGMLAIDDSNNVSFTYTPDDADPNAIYSAAPSNGQYITKTYPLQDTAVVTQSTTPNGTAQTHTYNYYVAKTYTDLAADGRMGGFSIYTSTWGPDPDINPDDVDPLQTFIRAFASDSGGELEYRNENGDGSTFANLGILPIYPDNGPDYEHYTETANLGNAGIVAGYFSASYGATSFTANGAAQWLTDTTTNPGQTYYPAVFSPAGTSAGYLGSIGGGSITAICTTAGPAPVLNVYPLAISDDGSLVADDTSTTFPEDTLTMVKSGTVKRLSSLVPDAYKGKVQFPRNANIQFDGTAVSVNGPYCWINNNGDIVVHGLCRDDQDPSGQTWVSRTLLLSKNLNTSQTDGYGMAIVQFPANYEQEKQFNNNGVFVAAVSAPATDQAPAHDAAALLIPVETDVVNRDDLTQNWTNNKLQSASATVYSGTTTGDMAEWKLNVLSTWLAGTFTWTATDSQGNVITGPAGIGVDHWQISNGGNDPENSTSLTWRPDTYTIKCNIAVTGAGTFPIQFNQKIGWRTEDYLVIGQIVNTNTYLGPTSGSDGNYVDAISYDIGDNFGRAGYSLSGWVLPGPGAGSVVELFLDSGAVSDSTLGMMELGFWGSVGGGSAPKGPFATSYPNNIGSISSGNRFWMLQNALNFSVDLDSGAPSTIPAASLSTLKEQEQYRLFHHYQTRFCLTTDGKIDTATLYDIHKDELQGPTKINWQIPAGAYSVTLFGNTVSSPQIGPFTIPAKANPKNGVQTSSDGTQHSSYASGRVGIEGQNANWRIMGKDVPWIFSEIICQVEDHNITSTIKLSVNKTWQTTGFVTGGNNFNNLNIYQGTMDSGTGLLNYLPVEGSPLSMNGQLEAFIDSVPIGTWPNKPTTPTVQ